MSARAMVYAIPPTRPAPSLMATKFAEKLRVIRQFDRTGVHQMPVSLNALAA